jgi:predicted hydrocarbon binding protein
MTEPDDDASPSVNGLIVVARFEYLRNNHGAASVQRVLEALPPEATVMVLDRTIAAVLADLGEAVYERLGEEAARLHSRWLGEHRTLVSPHAFLSILAEDHRRLHSFGRASYRRVGFNEGEISYRDYPEIDPTYCRSGRAFLRASIELLQGPGVVVEETQCQSRGDAACVYAIRWPVEGRGSGPL